MTAEAISRLTFTAANYEEAILFFKKRFASKLQILNKHLDTLHELGDCSVP